VPKKCLGLFAKYWEPGKVKTRLAASVGDVKAARVYKTFVAATIARLSAIESQHVLAYSPDDDATHAAFTAADLNGWSLTAQSAGDLGNRMADFFENRFNEGAESVVLVGTDSPNLPLIEVQEAYEHLKTCDVVIGPTEDGGYYLVGATRNTPPIFDDIPWSTPEVLPTTIERLNQADISLAQLDPWYDVDEVYDLHRLIEDLRNESRAEPALQVLLNHLLEILEE